MRSPRGSGFGGPEGFGLPDLGFADAGFADAGFADAGLAAKYEQLCAVHASLDLLPSMESSLDAVLLLRTERRRRAARPGGTGKHGRGT